MFQDRWYQTECVDALFADVMKSTSIHPIAVAPTGSGKTPIMCRLVNKIISHDACNSVLVLTHDKRILGQNYKALSSYFDGIDIGLYSAGLNSRIIKQFVTVAGIQSVHKKPELFKNITHVIIDECHLINTENKGMYRNFLSKIKANYIGLTATHFRTKTGYIHEGDDALFNHMSYDLSEPDKFNRLIDEGFLSPIYSIKTAMALDTDGLKLLGGDYAEKQMSERFDKEEIIGAAIIETVHYGKNYKHWLFFAIDIKNAENITAALCERGISAVAIHSRAENVDQKIEDFKSGKYRAAVQVNMLTTGFDFPGIDLIADLRPTKSPIIHVQGKGRGLRVVYATGFDLNTIEGRLEAIKAGPKQHCLVLDFAGNTKNLGPINHIDVKLFRKKVIGKGGAITKTCPNCNFINYGATKFCENCDHEFKFETKITATAAHDEIVIRNSPIGAGKKFKGIVWLDVDDIAYSRHKGRNGKRDTLSVRYSCGLKQVIEWVAIEHTGYAKYKALNWVKFRWGIGAIPNSIDSILRQEDKLKAPKRIRVDFGKAFPQILDCEF